jgi:hypothetical protein
MKGLVMLALLLLGPMAPADPASSSIFMPPSIGVRPSICRVRSRVCDDAHRREQVVRLMTTALVCPPRSGRGD